MLTDINQSPILAEGNDFIMKNCHFTNTISQFFIVQINNIYQCSRINNIKTQSKLIIIDNNMKTTENYLIICFDELIIIIIRSQFNLLKEFFVYNQDSSIYLTSYDIGINLIYELGFVSDCNNFNYYALDDTFSKEINSFLQHFQIKNKEFESLFNFIKRCISGYLIKKSYLKSNYDRIENYKEIINFESNDLYIEENEYIKLRIIGTGSSSYVYLIYHIEREELFAMKTYFQDERLKLYTREKANYEHLHHPFFPRLFGHTLMDQKESLIIEYINGKSLNEIKKLNLKYEEKLKIIFQIMIIIKYIHDNNFIYRDLKPNNFMIDQNKTVILIDFDRMIECNDIMPNATNDFNHHYIAPEIHFGISFSKEVDIFSLGLIIYFVICEKDLSICYDLMHDYDFNELSQSYPKIQEICSSCTKQNPEKREKLTTIINNFYVSYIAKINPQILETDVVLTNENIHSLHYFEYWVFLSECNHNVALFELGFIYFKGSILPQDISKAIKYFILSAEKNNIDAQFYMGNLYYDGKYIEQNIEIAVKYFINTSDFFLESMHKLGLIYYLGKYKEQDIDKAIYYLTIPADKNYLRSQFLLAYIYYEGKYIDRDINKALFYFSAAAEQNHFWAQYYIGLIYYEGEYIEKDINIALFFFIAAAKQNHPWAQYYIGLIYYEGKYIGKDINKALSYFSAAAEQNHHSAQFYIGLIYYKGELVNQDISKSIHYFKLSSDQNNPCASFNLGLIYFEEKSIYFNINRSIHYFLLSANFNHSTAQLYLGVIY